MSDMHKMKRAANGHIEHATGILDDAKESISNYAGEVKKKGEEAWEDAQERGEGAWKNVKKYISKNPGAAIGYAIVTGALLHALFSRKED